MGINGIGMTELIIVLVIALIVLGPKRLPEAGRSLGRGMREFKDSVTGKERDELPAADAGEAPGSAGAGAARADAADAAAAPAPAEPTEQKT